jgi:hypothetical protein
MASAQRRLTSALNAQGFRGFKAFVLRTIWCCAVLCCAVLCGAVRCGAVRCGAVLRCAVLQEYEQSKPLGSLGDK